MDAKTLKDAKADLEKLMDEAVDNHEPVIITRQGKPPVVSFPGRLERPAGDRVPAAEPGEPEAPAALGRRCAEGEVCKLTTLDEVGRPAKKR